MPGHLRATCPILRDEAMKQATKDDQQKEEDILVMESAEPLPVVHDDGCLRWQNECATDSRDYVMCPTTSVGIGACALGRTGST